MRRRLWSGSKESGSPFIEALRFISVTGTSDPSHHKGVLMREEVAILAGGCYWGAQELLRRQPGVVSTRVGWCGGETPNPTDEHHGDHAEAVESIFDADVDGSGMWPGKVVTEVMAAGPFWAAEEDQDYLQKHPDGETCHFVRPDWTLPGRSSQSAQPQGPPCSKLGHDGNR